MSTEDVWVAAFVCVLIGGATGATAWGEDNGRARPLCRNELPNLRAKQRREKAELRARHNGERERLRCGRVLCRELRRAVASREARRLMKIAWRERVRGLRSRQWRERRLMRARHRQESTALNGSR